MPLIGRYETSEQIGRGAMGIVYRARDTTLDRFVALKVLIAGPDLDAEMKERFYREAKAGARLQHPNLVTIYDLGEADGGPFIAMELLAGADLRSLIAQKRNISLAQKIEFVAQMCDGIAHAHEKGFVHRDIKPSNIFIHQNRQAKILDFGIARLPTSNLTRAGIVLGTPNYMSPEQIKGQPCDIRSDIFSAAIVFYEFLVYAHPFRAAFIPQRIAREAPDSLYDHDHDLPPGLEELIFKGLAKKPEDRFQTMEAFGNGFREILQRVQPYGMERRPSTQEPESAEDDDSYRLRFEQLSEKLDTSLPSGDLSSSRALIEQMRELASTDTLLFDSLRLYEQRYAEASKRLNEGVVEPREVQLKRGAAVGLFDAPDVPAEDKDATSISDLDADRNGWMKQRTIAHDGEASDISATPKPQSEPKRPTATLEKFRSTTLPAWLGQLRLAAGKFPFLGDKSATPYRYAIAGVAAVVVLVVLGAFVSLMRTIPAEPFISQAEIGAHGADILDGPSAQGRKVTSLRAGTKVNLLEHLKSNNQQWVRVQYVASNSRENSRPGYTRVGAIGIWSITDPQTTWEFVSTSTPSEKASVDEIEEFTNRLEFFAGRFPAMEPRADLERCRLYVALGQQSKNRGETSEDRKEAIRAAKDSLARLPKNLDASLIPVRNKLSAEIDGLSTEATPQPQNPPVEAPAEDKVTDEADTLINQAAELWTNANYERALKRINEALNISAHNKRAFYWKKRIEASIEAEREAR